MEKEEEKIRRRKEEEEGEEENKQEKKKTSSSLECSSVVFSSLLYDLLSLTRHMELRAVATPTLTDHQGYLVSSRSVDRVRSKANISTVCNSKPCATELNW